MIKISNNLQIEIMKFFLSTSIPKMIDEKDSFFYNG